MWLSWRLLVEYVENPENKSSSHCIYWFPSTAILFVMNKRKSSFVMVIFHHLFFLTGVIFKIIFNLFPEIRVIFPATLVFKNLCIGVTVFLPLPWSDLSWYYAAPITVIARKAASWRWKAYHVNFQSCALNLLHRALASQLPLTPTVLSQEPSA